MSSEDLGIAAIEGIEGIEGLTIEGPEDTGGEQGAAVRPYAAVIRLPKHISESKLDTSAPAARLELEHVYGYRCTDRNNIAVNSAGALVYPASAVIVAMDPETRKQTFGQGHTDDINAFAQDPSNPDIIVSGQKCDNTKSLSAGSKVPPYICITNSRTGQVIRKIENVGTDGFITAIGVSHDGKTIAAGVVGATSTNLFVFSAATGENLLGQGKSLKVTDYVFDICFDPRNSSQFTAGFSKTTLDGKTTDGSRLATYSIEGTSLKQVAQFTDASLKLTALFAKADGGYIVGGWGLLATWAPGANSLSNVKEWGTKAQRVNSIAKYADNQYLVAGESRKIAVVDGKLNVLKIKDWPNGIRAIAKDDKGNIYVGERKSTIVKIAASFFSDAAEESKGDTQVLLEGFMAGEAWPIAQHPTNPNIIVVGGEDGRLIIHNTETYESTVVALGNPDAEDEPFPSKDATFDPTPTIARIKTTKPSQMSRAIDFSPDGKKLAVGTLGKAVHIYDVTSGYKLTNSINGEAWAECVRFSPDGKLLAIGNRLGKVKFIDTTTLKERFSFKTTSAGLIAMDWSTDSTFLRVIDTGAYPRIIQVEEKSAKQAAEAQVMNPDVQWASHTIRHWWDTEGVWVSPHGRPIHMLTQINSIAVNPSRTLIATGDDFGLVSLFRYPAVCPDWKTTSKFKANRFHGHCEHVSRVLFDNTGTRLFSTGGADLCTFQWKIVE